MTVPESHHRDWEHDAYDPPTCPRCKHLHDEPNNAVRWDGDLWECCSCWLTLDNSLNPDEIESLTFDDCVELGIIDPLELEEDA